MASRSPEYLTAEEIGNKDSNSKGPKQGKSSLAQSMKADLMLMLMKSGPNNEKLPIFYSHGGNA